MTRFPISFEEKKKEKINLKNIYCMQQLSTVQTSRYLSIQKKLSKIYFWNSTFVDELTTPDEIHCLEHRESSSFLIICYNLLNLLVTERPSISADIKTSK